MTSGDDTTSSTDSPGSADVGLLAPVWAGTTVEAASSDAAFVAAMVRAECAVARAQTAEGTVPVETAATIADVAGALDVDARALAVRAVVDGNPVLALVADLTAAVAAVDPEAAAFVHRGATSQDILDTAVMLVAARCLDLIGADLGRAAEAFAGLAGAHRDTVMPGRTLTQHAVPTTFGLKAAGWRAVLCDARARLAVVRASLPAQLGGAAGTLAAFGAFAEAAAAPRDEGPDVSFRSRPSAASEIREAAGVPRGDATAVSDVAAVGEGCDAGISLLSAYASELGLAEPVLPWHVLRTPIADLAGALAFAAGALGKTAADVLVLSRTEIGEISEGHGGASSAMPHKANPVRAALVAAAARQVPALASVLFGSMAAEDERPAGAWHAEWQPLREALRQVGGAAAHAAELAEGLRVHPDRMRQNLEATGGLAVSERFLAELSPLLGRPEARAAVTRATHRVATERVSLTDALAQEPAVAAVRSKERLRELADPAGYLGSARALTDRALRTEGTTWTS